mgnify:CR=1 FL=1
MLILYKFSLFNINRSYIVRNYGVAATFLGGLASNVNTYNLQITNKEKTMLMTTTPIIEGKRIVKYYGIVSGETIIGANVFRDLFASIRDIVGGRSGSYEEVLRMAKDTALKEMEAQAVIGVDLDYETVGGSGSMLMVTANGTAVKIEED